MPTTLLLAHPDLKSQRHLCVTPKLCGFDPGFKAGSREAIISNLVISSALGLLIAHHVMAESLLGMIHV